jgi:hypothetical protein
MRLAAMVQSPFFDGKQANWFHATCFFGRNRPKVSISALVASFTELISIPVVILSGMDPVGSWLFTFGSKYFDRIRPYRYKQFKVGSGG